MQPVLLHKNPISLSERGNGPAVVLAVANTLHQTELSQFLADHGFKVHLAKSPTDARELVTQNPAVVSILSVDTKQGESGWLTCKKMTMSHPKTRVVLIGNHTSPRASRLAAFVGAAAYVPATSSPLTIAKAAFGCELPSLN